MSAREGLYAVLSLSNLNTALLLGVTLSWNQNKTGFWQMGSLHPMRYLQGCIEWELSWKKGFVDTTNLGSFNLGTLEFLGTVFPRGASAPYIAGTVVLNSGNLSDMEACSEAAVKEENTAKFYNLRFRITTSTTSTSTSTSTSTT